MAAAQKKETLDQRWNREARKHLKGRTITGVRYMSAEEGEAWGWYSRPVALSLDNGTTLVIMRDDEGNDGGALLGMKSDGTEFTLPVL